MLPQSLRRGAALALSTALIASGVRLLQPAPALASGSPFSCSPGFYQIDSQTTKSQLKLINPVTNSMQLIGTGSTVASNAWGYNVLDNYMYGIASSTGTGFTAGDIVRMDSSGVMTDVGAPTGSITAGTTSIAGDIDDTGHLLLQGAASASSITWYSVNVSTRATTSFTVTGTTTANDFVWIGGSLYGISGAGQLVVINLTTDAESVYAISGTISTTGGFGAAFSDRPDELYAFNNGTGNVYQIKNFTGTTPTPSATLVQTITSSSSNDGDACKNADSPFDVPVATADSYQAPSGGTLTEDAAHGILANDTPATGITPSVVSGVSHGTLTLNTDGSFTYTRTTGYSGPDSFTYKDTDTFGRTSSTVTVSFTVVPTANDDTYTTSLNGALTVSNSAFGLLSNDSGSSITVNSHTAPSHGTLTSFTNSNGTFSYQPQSNWSGVDTFTYTVIDSLSQVSPAATVSIDVAPQVLPDSYSATSGAALGVPAATGVLANDTGTSLAVQSPASVTAGHGTLSLAADGSFTYTANTNFSGTDHFNYTAADASGLSGTTTVTLTVAPAVHNDAYSTVANTTLHPPTTATGVLGNDDGAGLTATIGTPPSHAATFTFNADGTFSYTPLTNYTGTDSFTYSAKDGASTPAGTATVNITVGPPAAPVANNDSATVNAGSSVNGAVMSNDTGTSPLTAAVIAGPGHGTLTPFNSDGTFTYVPSAGWSGPDSFTYQLTDPFAQTSNIATVSITVKPVAVADSATTAYATNVTGNVLSNDSGTSLTATLGTGPAHASSFTLGSNGGYSYTPAAGFAGTDTFTYTATDASSQSVGPVTVTITVNPPPAPSAVDDSVATVAGSPVSGNVLSNDSGTGISSALLAGPTHGTLTSPLTTTGSFTYAPSGGFSGADSFTYRITDAVGQTASATVHISVTPRTTGDSATVNSGSTVTVSVLLNDSGSSLSVHTVSLPTGGNAVISGGGSTIDYSADPTFSGTDSFTYTAIDGSGLISAPATVVVTVHPTAAADSYSTAYATTLNETTTPVLANDDGAGLSAVLSSAPSHASAFTLNSDGTFSYTPAGLFAGADSFSYTAHDSSGQTAGPVMVTISVGLPPAPQAVDDSFSGSAGGSVAGNVMVNDSVTPATGTAVALVSGPSHGTLTSPLSTAGDFTYAPSAGFSGTDSFTYKITDVWGRSSTATVSLTIDPTAVADTASVPAGGTVTISVLSNDLGSGLSVHTVGTPGHGAATISGGATTVDYTAPANWSGSDTFSYTAVDSSGNASNTATVTVTVTPTAAGDSYSTAYNTTLAPTAASGVLANDHGTALTAVEDSGPAHATSFTLNSDGSFSYTPSSSYAGPDSFTYHAVDGSAQATSTVTVNITDGFPAAPVANDDIATPDAGGSASGNVLINDTATLPTVTSHSSAAHGAVSLLASGDYTYSPSCAGGSCYSGPDSFTYTLTDAVGQTASATVNVTVLPVAVDDPSETATSGTTATIAVLPNDLGSTLSVHSVGTPGHGTAAISGGGSTIDYTPDSTFSGTDTFTYDVIDGSGDVSAAPATVTVDVLPLANDDSYPAPYNVPIHIAAPGVLFNDDGSGLTSAVTTGPSHGALTLGTDGTLDYTPAHNWVGADTFTYRITDSSAQTSTATVTITTAAALPVPVSGTIGHDANRNGTFDSGEGMHSVTVHLLNGTTLIGTATTDAAGGYTFTGLAPATYTVKVDPTTVLPGTTETVDPDGTLDNATDAVVNGVAVTVGPFLYAGASLAVSGAATGSFVAGGGGGGTITLTVTNNGPSTSGGPTTLTYTSPSGVIVNPAQLPGGCSMSGANVVCTVPQLPNGGSVTFPLAVSVAPGTTPGPLKGGSAQLGTSANDVAVVSAVAAMTVSVTAPVATPSTGAAAALSADGLILMVLGLLMLAITRRRRSRTES